MEIFSHFDEQPDKIHGELDEYCRIMLCDSVRHTIDNIELLYQDKGKKVLGNLYRNIVKENPECFEPYSFDGSKPRLKCKPAPGMKKLFNTLRNSKDLKGYASTYDAYLFYSKYDHFGKMVLRLSRRLTAEQLGSLGQGIELFPKVLLWSIVLLEAIFPVDQFIKEKRETVSAFIDGMKAGG